MADSDYQPRAIVPDKAGRPVKNSTGSDIAKYVAVQLDPTDTTNDPPEVVLPGAGEKIYGVVTSASTRVGVSPDVGIEDGNIGDVQTEGRTPMLVGTGGLTLGDDVAVDAAGAAVAAATGDIVIGKALTTMAAAGFAEVELAGAAQSVITP